MSCDPVDIVNTENTVVVNNNTAMITVVHNNDCNNVNVVQETTNVVEVVSFGPVGPTGIGIQGPSGSSAPFYQINNSDVWFTTSSLQITGSVTVSGSSTFTNIGPAIFSGSVQAPSITGSLLGTASFSLSTVSASFAQTASYALGPNEILQYTDFSSFPDPISGSLSFLYLDRSNSNLYRWDSTTTNYVLLNSQQSVNPSGSNGDEQLFFVDLATRTRLKDCTYNNGTNGVGATLTGNSNGTLSEFDTTNTIDATIPSLGNTILVRAQASALQNGIYEVTQTGSATAPFILTRPTYYDSGSEAYPSLVFVNSGSNYRGTYLLQQTANPTIGTSNLIYVLSQSPTTVQTLPILFMDTATTASLPAATYTSGSAYTTLPGFQARLTANVNGPLGVVAGVSASSGIRILVVSQSNPAHNGSYIVTNPGTTTTRWVLTRIDYAASTLIPTTREWVISRTGSLEFGSRYVISSASLNNSQIGTVALNFLKYGAVGSGGSSNFATSASFASTASFAPNYVLNSVTSSMLDPYVLTAVTSSMTVLSASFASTASFVRNAQTASYVLNAVSSSFASTASFAPNYVLNSVTSSMLAPYVLTATTSSMLSPYVLTSVTSSMTVLSASFANTASFVRNAQTASFVNPLNQTVTISGTAGTTLLSVGGDTFIFTGSLFVSGTVAITGSVSATSFTGSLLGTASSAISSSFASTASYVLNAVSSSFASISVSSSYSTFAATASFIDGGFY